MTALLAFCNGLGLVNNALLAVGRWIGDICLGLMVAAFLMQVFWRYVQNNALPWPEKASRFLMLWSTGLMAPDGLPPRRFCGVRHGGPHAAARSCYRAFYVPHGGDHPCPLDGTRYQLVRGDRHRRTVRDGFALDSGQP